MTQLIDEEKSVKSEERCGLAWLKGISYDWGEERDACIPFKYQPDNFNNEFFPGTCFHTDGDKVSLLAEGPVWKLNFPEAMKITKVSIYNRGDCCSERLENFKVIVGNEQYLPIEIGTTNSAIDWQEFTTDMIGTYVKI